MASIQPSAVVYREEQNFDWRVYALVLFVEVAVTLALIWLYQHGFNPLGDGSLSAMGVSMASLCGLGAPVVIFVGLLRMITEVTPTDVRIWFGWVPTYRRFIAIGSVQKIEVVTYRPIVDYGGWGLRRRRDGERCLRARGDRGVRIELTDGTRLLIGSQRPEALAVAIERSLRASA